MHRDGDMIALVPLIGLILFLILLLVAIRVGVDKDKPGSELHAPTIHKSGIYSIVRKSPRENIADHKPSTEALRKYLDAQNEDIEGRKLSAADKQRLLRRWEEKIEASIAEIERGDEEGAEFYYYSYSGDDPVCAPSISKGQFVTREQIFQYPNIIPPFHPGCRCELKQYRGDENLRETTVIGMRSLFEHDRLPSLPDWMNIIKSV